MTDQQQRVEAVFRDLLGRPPCLAAAARGYQLETGGDGTLFTTRPTAGARMVPRGRGGQRTS